MMRKNMVFMVALGVFVLFLTGCAGSSKYMKLAQEKPDQYRPGKNQSSVVFMRPSGLGFAIDSAVFDITGKDNKIIGIVSAKKKVIYKTDPGFHLFMVTGESGDFMKANLEAGKTYYALISPRMGMWKARFTFEPVTKAQLSSDEFKQWFDSCELVENTPDTYVWVNENAKNIQSKKDDNIKDWQEKPDSEKPSLGPQDGR